MHVARFFSRRTKKKPEELWLGRSLEALSQHTIDGSTGSRGQSGHSSPSVSSPARSPPGGSESGDSVVVPKSPRTPTCPVIGSMGHSIQHRFVNAIEMPPCPCDHCGKPVMFRGKRCKECKRKFHKQCALRATPSCGLPDGLVNHFKQVQFSFSGGEENPSPVAAACSLAVLPPVAGHVRQGRHQGHRPTVSVSVSAFQELLMLCWSYKEEERPDFTWLQKHLEKLPKKRLARSPSHPVKLSRSAESVF
ncbi:PREDICTED: kinase suppressor of Ras A-like [Priapulus caudatus]|uniref:Kinase suppressor of Ras A-like n=1 Tax=Priapulus caudatus TaxID=37621 RepID=A0ABM1DY55_PRICU|nr:PREDICTED: kinase suppressor of Ras A-like [Priapulus caudatus]